MNDIWISLTTPLKLRKEVGISIRSTVDTILPILRSVHEQIRDAFKKIESILGEAGGNFSHVIEMTTYHVGLREHIDLFRSIRDEFVVEPYPAWTAIEVSGFITDGAIVEIRVVAHLPLKVR